MLIAAFITIAFLWLNLILWLTVSETVSWNFYLITQTIKDAVGIIFLLILVIMLFGDMIYVLNKNRLQGDYGDALYEEAFSEGYGFLDAILSQFLVSFGQGDTTNYSKFSFTKNRDLAWVMFIAVTFIVQLFIMNVAIAVMGDTFDNLTSDWKTKEL